MKRELKWDMEGEGTQGSGVGGLCIKFSVVDVGKGCGHFFDILQMVGTVSEVPIANKLEVVMLWVGLDIDGMDFVTGKGWLLYILCKIDDM